MTTRPRGDAWIARELSAARDASPGRAERVLEFVRGAVADLERVPTLDVIATDRGIARIEFGRGRTEARGAAARRCAEQVRAELAEFFAAERAYFTVPLDLSHLRPFQHSVLAATAAIPLGEVRSYRWVAETAGNRSAVRAVGTALRTNPVPLLLPCHRVVRSDGSLGGYAGGVPWKRRLLLLERAIPAVVGRVEARRFCRTGCPEERGMPEAARVVFSSVAEARASGYRPCPVCRPDRERTAISAAIRP